MVKISKNKGQLEKRGRRTKVITATKKKDSTNNGLLYWGIGASVLTFFLSIFFFPESLEINKVYVSQNRLYILNFIYTITVFLSIYFSNIQIVKKATNLFFLLLFSFTVFFYLSIFGEIKEGFLLTTQLYLKFGTIPISVLGIITIWQNKSLLIEKEKEQNILDVDKNESFFKRKITYLSSLGAPTLILFSAITLLTAGLLFYELDSFDFWSDEKQTTQAAVGYYRTGEYYQWDFIKDKANTGKEYNRALPHVWLVAQSYKLFGVSEWSSRFVSAISGILFIIFGFFVALFFTKSRLAALLFIFAIALNYHFLHLFRWTRMYAILIPYTLLVFYLLYNTIVKTNKFVIINKSVTSFINKYLNFNFLYFLFLLPILFLGFKIHPNFLAILPPVILFLIYLAISEKERKYYFAIVLVILFFLVIYLFFPEYIPSSRISLFEVYNSYYLNGFFDRPFNLFSGLILLIIGIGVLLFSKDKKKKLRLAFLYTFTLSFYILFTYVADYPQSFRYISHLAPISILLIVGIYSSLFLIYSRLWQIILLSALIVGNLGSHFYKRYPDLYIDNPVYNAQPSIAFQTIENLHKNGEAVFLQYSMPYYLKDLDPSTPMINMSRDKNYTYQTFLRDINSFEAGWISWSSFNQHHIDDDIIQYCSLYFKKYHGYGIDETNKEVFYFKKENIVADSIYKIDSNFPQANLKLSKPYSITFWIGLNKETDGFPLKLMNESEDLIQFTQYDDGNFYTKYNKKDSIRFMVPLDSKLHFFSLEQSGNQVNDSVRIFIDKQMIANIKLSYSGDTLAKIHVNRRFNGQVDDMRVYAYQLNEEQRNILSTRELSTRRRELMVKRKSFTPLFYWTKN